MMRPEEMGGRPAQGARRPARNSHRPELLIGAARGEEEERQRELEHEVERRERSEPAPAVAERLERERGDDREHELAEHVEHECGGELVPGRGRIAEPIPRAHADHDCEDPRVPSTALRCAPYERRPSMGELGLGRAAVETLPVVRCLSTLNMIMG